MSEERLKEIKDMIDSDYDFCRYFGIDFAIPEKELELYNEVIRLREENEKIRKQNLYEHKYGSDMEGKYIVEKAKNDKAIKYIENTPLYTETYDYNMEDNLELNYVSDEKAHNDLLNILRGENK